MGKAKPAPQAEHSIPRLELCGAVLATEIGQLVAKQLDILPSKIKYFTDSKVVLGYIRNRLTSLNSESKFAKNPCEYPVTSHPSQYLLGMLFATTSFH
jgi:hypothetical protein